VSQPTELDLPKPEVSHGSQAISVTVQSQPTVLDPAELVPGAAEFRRRRRPKRYGAAAAELFILPPLHLLAPPPDSFQRRAEFFFCVLENEK
jgi:hypothetical protein